MYKTDIQLDSRSSGSTRMEMSTALNHFVVLKLIILAIFIPRVATVASEDLFSALFTDYQPKVMSISSPSDYTNVSIGMAVNKIIDVEEENHVLRSSLWLRFVWRDSRLQWDPANYSDIDTLYTTNDVWKPDISIFEDVRDEEIPSDKFPVKISSDGTIVWSVKTVMRSNCKLNVIYFPFDYQQCSLTFASSSYSIHVRILPIDGSGAMSDVLYDSNGEWDLVSVTKTMNDIYYPCCPGMPFTELEFSINMKRRASFYALNLIAPVILMSLLAAISFLIPAESGEKASLSVTVFLSQVVFGIVIIGYLPVQSLGTPIIALFLILVQVAMAISTLVNVLIVCVNFRGSHGKHVPRWMKKHIIYNLGKYVGLKDTVKKYRDKDDEVSHIRQEWSKAIAATKTSNTLFRRIREATGIKVAEAAQNAPSSHQNERKVRLQVQDVEGSGTGASKVKKTENEDVHHQILRELQKLNANSHERDKEDLVRLEWALVAGILDRLLFFIFLIVAVGLSLMVVGARFQSS